MLKSQVSWTAASAQKLEISQNCGIHIYRLIPPGGSASNVHNLNQPRVPIRHSSQSSSYSETSASQRGKLAGNHLESKSLTKHEAKWAARPQKEPRRLDGP